MKTSTTKDFKQLNIKNSDDFTPIQDVKQDFNSSPTTIFTPKTLEVKGSFRSDNSETYLRMGQKYKVKDLTDTTYNVLLSDFILGVYSTTSARSLILPPLSLAGPGKAYIVKDAGGSATSNNITVSASDLIDGQSTYVINTNYWSTTFVGNERQDGWYII